MLKYSCINLEKIMRDKILLAMVVAPFAGAVFSASDFTDTAQVISSKPVIERVTESRQECDPAPVPPKNNASNVMAPIVGGLLGGLIGHQVGHGSGQTAATVVGATGGAVAGSVLGEHANTGPAPLQQCRTIETSREVVKGYDVTYRYNGREVKTMLAYNPGEGGTLKVGVAAIADVHAAESAQGQYGNDQATKPGVLGGIGSSRNRGRHENAQ